MQGFLHSEGINISQRRIGQALRLLFPIAHYERVMTSLRHINPVPYQASYFGEKLHFDQNEKLNMFGCVHVLAIDGFSRKNCRAYYHPQEKPCYYIRPFISPITPAIWHLGPIEDGPWD